MDLATDDPRDPHWTARVLTAVTRQEEDDARRVTELELSHDLAVWVALALLRSDPQAIRSAGERAGAALTHLRRLARPWDKQLAPDHKAMIASAREEWSRVYQLDLDDPEVQANVEKVALALEAQMAEAVT